MIYCEICKFFRAERSPEAAALCGQIYECSKKIINCPEPSDFCSKGKRKTANELVFYQEKIKREVDEMCFTSSLTQLDELEVSAHKNLRKVFDLNYKRLEEQQEGKRK